MYSNKLFKGIFCASEHKNVPRSQSIKVVTCYTKIVDIY